MRKSTLVFWAVCLIFGIINLKFNYGLWYSLIALCVAAVITVIVKNKYKFD